MCLARLYQDVGVPKLFSISIASFSTLPKPKAADSKNVSCFCLLAAADRQTAGAQIQKQ